MIPSELRNYLEAVKEANERIVAEKKRQMNPDLTEQDKPWLFHESDQIGLQLRGFVPDGEEVPSGALSAYEADKLSKKLMIPEQDYSTWQDVFDAAEKMNAEIDKLLKDG